MADHVVHEIIEVLYISWRDEKGRVKRTRILKKFEDTTEHSNVDFINF